MTNWWSGDIVADGIRMYYTWTSGDGPPLVLAHGMADSGLCWGNSIRREQFEQYLATMRGFLADVWVHTGA